MTAGIEQRIAEAGHDDVPLRVAWRTPGASFDQHARAYLEAIWVYRRTAVVLASDDVPPGFDRIRRARTLARFREWLPLLDIDSSVSGRLLVRILTAALSEAAVMVMNCDDAADAAPVIDAGIAYINRLTG
jgi:hypothetical protein